MSRQEKRAAARLAAVQALYQMDVAKKGINEILAEFEAHWIGQEVEGDQYNPAEVAFFRNILEGVLADQGEVDVLVDRALQQGWPLRRVEAVLRAILRAGAYELLVRKDVPARVAITEYTDIAGAFFEGEEVGLVNGVLDALARRLRPDELMGTAR
ncbi:transcription antitermination factor NusB [Lichenibacterium ramalinae]|uniref:Transcription antitermination protein NusB n=1 Tax=Lichenibacterium ramalinae TaxID=2316527 RepID=A0A4Q2RGX2_9HYPH|nr:transcription antitermination factor NusB [Lichenibacterium ramalinae]RYB06313.1 transcription antitermination factor NusB [Lichenibacterium ramalinae]